MNNFTIITLIVATCFAFELLLKPRIDRTRKGDILLWYGVNYRSYVVLFKSKK